MDSSSVVTTQVDSISSEALVSSTVPCTTDSCTTDVPTEQQPSSSRKRAATDYLSIGSPLEIKKIGVEVSDEEAQQFQNDITRLSPVTVGLREKTLQEVSLTPQTCKRRAFEANVSSTLESHVATETQKLADEQSKEERLTSQICTATASDSSDIIHDQIEFHECATGVVELGGGHQPQQGNLENDPLTSHHDILSRLNSDRPQEFTDDSAESLALATGVRDEVRSDGSDSGLGCEIPGETGPNHAPESDSETLFLDRIQQVDILSTDQKDEPTPQLSYPLKSNLKRRLTDCIDDGPSAKRQADEPAKKKRSIQFDAVTVYYFPRAQGFTCVPSQGGSTLGMSATHTHAERFSLTEHAAEQRRLHRARLAQLRSERAANCVIEGASSSEDPSDDTDEEPTDTEELDIDSYYFLQPVPTWQRRALLRAAGVRRIDTCEKDDCRDIRASREHCGCACKGYCDPESCPCSRANVKCQVDRAGFPCGCSRDGCANSSGRIEFNPVRVRTHFIHTLMRLEIEKKQHPEEQHNETNISTHNVQQAPNINVNGFESLHYDSGQDNRNGTREDSLDLYAMRDDCYANDESIENSSGMQRKNVQSEFGQTSSFPSFAAAVSVGFQQNNYADYASYQTLPSTSAVTFQCRGFNYNSPYANANTAYDASFVDETSESQYTNLNAVQPPMNAVVQQMNKLEPFSELLAGRYSYLSDVESNPVSYPTQVQAEHVETPLPKDENEVVARDDNPTDDDNFGEIIKKSMVETVSA